MCCGVLAPQFRGTVVGWVPPSLKLGGHLGDRESRKPLLQSCQPHWKVCVSLGEPYAEELPSLDHNCSCWESGETRDIQGKRSCSCSATTYRPLGRFLPAEGR